MQRLRLLLILAVFVTVLALQTIPTQAYSVSGWERYYEGIQYATGYVTSPRLMRAFALRISLRNPDVWMYASHDNGGSPYEVALQTTPAFVADHGLKAAVNGSFFDPGLSPNTNIFGLLVSSGTVVSYPEVAPFNGQLVFAADKVAHIIMSDQMTGGIWQGIGGAELILSGGVNYGWDTDPQPVTGYGLSQDGKFLIMVCVDGRQPGWSDGATMYNLAQWMIDFGAYEGIHMDGGGSTTMALGSGVMNRPCYGYNRAVGDSLGVGSIPVGIIGPNVCKMNANRLDMIIRGNQNHVILKTWTAAGGWAAPVDLVGNTIYAPAIVSRYDGCLDVFETCADNNQLYQKTWTSGGGWGNWVSLGGTVYSGPSVCSMNANHWYVVYRTTGNIINYLQWNNGTYTYGSLQGSVTEDPCIISRANGSMDLFERCADNGKLYWKTYTNGTWGSWVDLGGILTSSPAAASRNATNWELFYRGSNYNLWFLRWDNGVYSYGDLGGPQIAGKPAVCCLSSTTDTIYVRTTDDYQYLKAWVTNGWTPYTNQGAYY